MFHAEIQDGCQKWREVDFWGKSPLDSADILQLKNFTKIAISHRFQDKCTFAFYAEVQDGRQNGNFGEKLPVDSTDILCVKNFVETAISRTVSEINVHLRFMQKFKMAINNGLIIAIFCL